MSWLLFLIVAWSGSQAEAASSQASLAYEQTMPHPPYPSAALALDIAGTVKVRVFLDSSGKVVRTAINQSSGSQMLDLSTRAFIEDHWHFPAKAIEALAAAKSLVGPSLYAFNMSIVYECGKRKSTISQFYSANNPAVPELSLRESSLSTPPLPALAKRYGAGGTVVVEAQFSTDQPDAPMQTGLTLVRNTIVESSGSDLLDLFALSYADRHWELSPVVVARFSHRPASLFTVRIPISFPSRG